MHLREHLLTQLNPKQNITKTSWKKEKKTLALLKSELVMVLKNAPTVVEKLYTFIVTFAQRAVNRTSKT